MPDRIRVVLWFGDIRDGIRQNAQHFWSWRHFPVIGFVIIALTAGVTRSCEKTRFMHALEMANLDAWVASQDPMPSSQVALVDIDEEEYKTTFQKTSPLARDKVRTLIGSVAKAGASVIVIDIDTSEWTKNDLPSTWWPGVSSGNDARLVWARTVQKSGKDLILNDVAGWHDGEPENGASLCWGVPEILENSGVVRTYRPRIPIGPATVPSLATAAAIVYQSSRQSAAADDGNTAPALIRNCDSLKKEIHTDPDIAILTLNRSRFAKYHAGDITAFAAGGPSQWKPLTGKIVVLGGTFAEARDSYLTTLGRRDGITILASAIDSQLNNPMPLEPSGWKFWIVDILLGVVILVVGRILPRALGLPVVILAIPAVAFLGSFLLYDSSSYFVSFMPVLLGVFLHKVFDQWWEAFDARKKNSLLWSEVEELNKKVERLRFEIAEIDDTRKTLSERDSVNLLLRITRGPA